jgi:hypothetical protein
MLKTVAIGFLSVNIKKNATGCGLPTCHPEARLAKISDVLYQRLIFLFVFNNPYLA